MQQTGLCLVVFARAPVAGKVKTRLIPELGAQGAMQAHRLLLARTLATAQTFVESQTDLKNSPERLLQLWVDDQPDHPDFARFQGPIRRQDGPDLGVRMANCCQDILSKYSKVLIVGTDCPGLNGDYLTAAEQALEKTDVVLGPAMDGGYVLIGMRNYQSGIFQDISWGSEHVLAQTLAQLERVGIGYALLPELADIDRPEDLPILARYAGNALSF